MIAVSALPTYLFCPRKMYLQYVLEVKPIEADVVVKGDVKHAIFDHINKAEEEIVNRISTENIQEAAMMYKQEYYKAMMQTIEQKQEVIEKVGINKMQLLEETWQRILQEAETRAKNVIEFAQQNQIFGKELWDNLKPKYITELTVASNILKLRGRIDRVEVEEEKYTPIELKTGKMPFNGMWPGDRIQLGAYILLLQRKYKSEHGYLEYVQYGVRKKLTMEEPLKRDIITLVGEVHDTIRKRELPRKCDNQNKCASCIMRKGCREITMNYALEKESPEDHENPYSA
ncbi:MAG: CRISPR-associated protein Cas4 [archaeon]